MLKLYRPAMKSAFLMSLVVARKPAVFTTLPGPNRMPSRLMTNTRPLAVNVPMISDGPRPPVTRLSATDELLGWLKRTLSLARMLNVFQLMIALLLDWLMITDAPPWPWMVAAPPTTVPPSGPAAAGVKPSGEAPSVSSAVSGREQQIAQAWMHRGVLLQPSGEDEEESRVLARACLQQFGHGPGAQQALALRDLRNRQISGNRVQPSQP